MSETPTLQNGRFYGGVVGSIAGQHLTLAETTYTPGFQVPPHEHATPFVCMVVRGSLVEEFESERYELAAGSVFYHPGVGVHSERFGARGGRCFVTQMSAQWTADVTARGLALPSLFLSEAGGEAARLCAEAHRELARGDTTATIEVEERLLAILTAVARDRPTRERRRPCWLSRATELIETRYLDAVSLAQVAAEVDHHPSHVARTFSHFHGCTVGEFVRRLRLDHARELLAGSERTLTDVALETGFSDQSHFTRSFKERFGRTPGAYRARRGTSSGAAPLARKIQDGGSPPR
jgi:AraC family transcriptional regulator